MLKCDIKKFFHSIDQQTLVKILNRDISDKDIIALLQEIITSFSFGQQGTGLSLGNLTSQLFTNVYMNEFDQFVKHRLKVKYYIRYADDFVILSEDKNYLEEKIFLIRDFLKNELHLILHLQKILIKTFASGVDFLGWVNFSYHIVIRNKTKKKIFKRIKSNKSMETLNSYLGLLSHGDTDKLKNTILKLYIKNYDLDKRG